jgi:hypothetical protein
MKPSLDSFRRPPRFAGRTGGVSEDLLAREARGLIVAVDDRISSRRESSWRVLVAAWAWCAHAAQKTNVRRPRASGTLSSTLFLRTGPAEEAIQTCAPSGPETSSSPGSGSATRSRRSSTRPSAASSSDGIGSLGQIRTREFGTSLSSRWFGRCCSLRGRAIRGASVAPLSVQARRVSGE